MRLRSPLRGDVWGFFSRSLQLSILGVLSGVTINSLVDSLQSDHESRSTRLFFLLLQYLMCMLTVYVLLQWSMLNVSRDGEGNFSNIFFTVIFFSVQTNLSNNLNKELHQLGVL